MQSKLLARLASFVTSFSVLVCPFTQTQVYRHNSNSEMKIALTFDDGPHPKYTPEILSILDEYGIKATFFIVGENAGYHPEIVRREISAGHEVGNHTFLHNHLSDGKLDVLKSEILKCENAIYEASEVYPKLFRPPEGRIDRLIESVAEKLDYTVILWNIDTRDWAHTDSNTIIKGVLDSVKSGDIILMHDFISGESHTAEALRQIIPELLNRGYTFVTVSELLCAKK